MRAGGEKFFGLDWKTRLQGRMVDTSHLAAVKKGYFFTIYAAWESRADGSLLKKSLDSVRFTKAVRKPDAAPATKTSADQSIFHGLAHGKGAVANLNIPHRGAQSISLREVMILFTRR